MEKVGREGGLYAATLSGHHSSHGEVTAKV